MANIARKDDFVGDLEVVMLIALLLDCKTPLNMTRDATEEYQRLEFRMKSIQILNMVQARILTLQEKLKAGVPAEKGLLT